MAKLRQPRKYCQCGKGLDPDSKTGKCAKCYKLWLKTQYNGKRFGMMTVLEYVDNKIGYKADNIVFVCKTINVMKNNLEEKDFIAFCKAVAMEKDDDLKTVIADGLQARAIKLLKAV